MLHGITSNYPPPTHTPLSHNQPTHVSWKLDGSLLEHRTRGQRMQWMAWNGPKDVTFEPPNKPSHMTMSMVSVGNECRLK